MITEVIERQRKPAISTSIDIKNQVIDSLAFGKTSFDIAKEVNYPNSTIRSFHQHNKEAVDKKKQELILQLPNIVESVKTDIETNSRLSRHISLDFTSVDSNLIALKNTLDKVSLNVLKISSIFPTNALLNFNQFNQDNRQVNIEPSIMGLFSGGFNDNMEVVDMKEVSDSDDVTNV